MKEFLIKDCEGNYLYIGNNVIWKDKFGIEFNCEVVFDLVEWCGWCLKNKDFEAGLIPIGKHGARIEDIILCY